MKSIVLTLVFILLISSSCLAFEKENQPVVRWFVNNATGEVYKPPFYAGDNYFIERFTGKTYYGLAYCLKMVELGKFTVIIPDTPTPTPTPTPPLPTATPYPTPRYRANAKYYYGENDETRLKINAEGEWEQFSLLVYVGDRFIGSIDQSGSNIWQGDLGIPENVDLRNKGAWIKDTKGNSADIRLLGRYFENTQAVYTPSDQFWYNYEKNLAVIESSEKYMATPTPVSYITCEKCSGSGRITKMVKTTFGVMKKTVKCPDCDGKGKVQRIVGSD